ncbi:hypothetical protein J421_3837 [Gemmatirosa kalamazoonensis]|uniref:Uncharacterized protein n=1 Tax=Gemmatirosa kalamazoonensis TaxID=861299 RepID=W0RJV5_9BACT|nr:hypothetical protein [Gemmatirosa kalamazoonensis]AHG91374.1 hypothetical protein J421_3837 [Gemmatirosa kalamazoonensis]
MSSPESEPTTVRVFVNERGVDVPRGASALDALRVADEGEAARVAAGERALVDSRGLPTAADAPTFAGAIYRTITAR